jgi:hypothetical protein
MYLILYKYLKSSTRTVVKGKAVPVQAWTGTGGSRRFRLPDFKDSRYMKVVRLSALRTPAAFTLRKYSWYSFLLEAESTPGP